MKPMYALHKDETGSILAATSFSYDYEIATFIRNADLRPGDSIHFGEAIKRQAEAEPLPAFLSEEEPGEPAPPPTEKPILPNDEGQPALADDEQPF
jgi:hypothetical protein